MSQSYEAPSWNASLSTMWAIPNFVRLSNFYPVALKLQFAAIELNFQVTPAMLDSLPSNGIRINSIHEPCPAKISAETLKARDWVISATAEDCRNQGILSVKNSIDLAAASGVNTIVVHAGNIHSDNTLERRLRALIEAGLGEIDEAMDVRSQLVKFGRDLVRPRMEAVKKSLHFLLDYAGPKGIRLGLENRNHYLELPGVDEMAELLALADQDRLGFIYDTGHAYALQNLGFNGADEWLERYSGRLIGLHLHDIMGFSDHRPPGTGEIDFTRLSKYVSPDSFRTLEVRPSVSVKQICYGMQYLYEKGIVTCLN